MPQPFIVSHDEGTPVRPGANALSITRIDHVVSLMTAVRQGGWLTSGHQFLGGAPGVGLQQPERDSDGAPSPAAVASASSWTMKKLVRHCVASKLRSATRTFRKGTTENLRILTRPSQLFEDIAVERLLQVSRYMIGATTASALSIWRAGADSRMRGRSVVRAELLATVIHKLALRRSTHAGTGRSVGVLPRRMVKSSVGASRRFCGSGRIPSDAHQQLAAPRGRANCPAGFPVPDR